MTALYFHGLSIKAPNSEYDITVKKNYNSVKLKNHNVFYVSDDIYELGLTENKQLVLIVMGSLGSMTINKELEKIALKFKDKD